MLLEAVMLGLLVFMIYLVLKRISYHNTPTPVNVLFIWFATLTTMHVIMTGVIGDDWAELGIKFIFILIGFGSFLHFGGDLAYYRAKYMKPSEGTNRVYAPEDDPNWSNHKPN